MAGRRRWFRRFGLRSGVMRRRWRRLDFLCWSRIRAGVMDRVKLLLGLMLRILGMGIFATFWLGLRNRFRRRLSITIAWGLPGGVMAGVWRCGGVGGRGGFMAG